MKQGKKLLMALFSAVAMLILILDAEATLAAARDGIALCINTVIPSLFPFFYISSLLNGALLGRSYGVLKPLGRLCRIPEGSESIFLMGALGGYPVGAKSIYEAYEAGALSKQEAERMLGFCNNAGPAFLFGISGALFKTPLISTVLYGVLIISSILTGILLPGGSQRRCIISYKATGTPLIKPIQAMATVCGWVILFRVLLTFLHKWIFWLFPQSISVFISGLLELTNGCIALNETNNIGFRFIILCVMMSFGGLCVCMQTVSVTGELSCKYYCIGKLIQTYIALSVSLLIASILFPGNIPVYYGIIALLPVIAGLALQKSKNYAGNYLVHGV